MSVVHNPHDKFFKATMSNVIVARDFFRQHLSEAIRAHIDFDTLELQPGSYIDKALQYSASDMLYKIRFLKDFECAYIYVLAEHQSSVDNLMPFRLWQYVVSIWNDHIKKNKQDKLPLVIPLVFYNGVRHEATEESCLRYLYGTRRPIVSPIESRIMNKELIRQCNEGLEIRGLTCKRQSLLVATTG